MALTHESYYYAHKPSNFATFPDTQLTQTHLTMNGIAVLIVKAFGKYAITLVLIVYNILLCMNEYGWRAQSSEELLLVSAFPSN